jgi:hypothetical protein
VIHDFIGAPDERRVFESIIETLTDSHRYTGRDKRASTDLGDAVSRIEDKAPSGHH